MKGLKAGYLDLGSFVAGGRKMSNRVPFPGELSTVIHPS